MEKIKEALQKAKISGTVNIKKVLDKNSSAARAGEADKIVDAGLESINYVNTKTVKLDDVHLEKHRVVALDRHGTSATALDSLRTQVLQKMYENNWRSIAIVSPTPGCGKTFVAINLAVNIASQPNKTAMLIDFDLRRPKVAKYLGVDLELSLNDFFNNNAELNDIMFNPELPRLVVLPTNAPVVNSSEALSSTKVDGLIREVYERYDSRVVIYDLPPILNADDALIMMRKVDCVLLVVGSGLVKEAEVEEAMHHIPKDKLLGVVLNKSESVTPGYYY